MTTGEKLTKLRKENNYTQEQLADILGVSRQAISRWESDLSYPETDKLIKLSSLYNCSMDYLLKDEVITNDAKPNNQALSLVIKDFFRHYEYKSKKTLFGMPLVHINIGFNTKAKGIIAIGTRATGFISIGLLSIGLLSIGLLSVGILALGVFALGLLMALGTIAVGTFAMGAIAIGFFAMGAIAVGEVAAGALAMGNFYAYGDYAYGTIAVGKTHAEGANTFVGGALLSNGKTVQDLINEIVPGFFRWFANLFK